MVEAGEPAWTDEDRAWVLAWQEYEADLCNGCGDSMKVTTDPANQFAYGGEPVRCHRCAAQERTGRKFADDGGDQAGIMIRMTKTPE